MTDLVQNLKIGNSTYTIQDGNTLPALTAAQRTTLLSNGTYLGKAVANGVKFENDSGKFEQFSDTITGSEINTSGITNANLNISGVSGPVQGAYSGTLLLFLSTSKTYPYTTDEGSTWQTGTLPSGFGSNNKYVTYADGTFAVVEINSNKLAYSTDGINWTLTSLPYTDKWCDIQHRNGKWFVISYNSSRYYLVSDSLEGPWTRYQYPEGTYVKIEYKDNYYFAFCSGNQNHNKVYKSADAHTWGTAISSFESSEVFYTAVLTFGDYFYVGLDTTNKIARSSDGVNWTKYDVTTYDTRIDSIIPVGNMLFLTTFGVYFSAYSNDNGETWTTHMYTNPALGGSSVVSTDSYVFVTGQSAVYNKVPFSVQHTYSLDPLSYTKSEVDTALASKQGTLTAGNGIDITSDTISAEEMVGADGVNIGKAGAVPRPAATDNTKFLRGDGTWAEAGGGGSASYDANTGIVTL